MDEGTRMKSMEENLRKLQSIVQQHSTAIEQWVSSSNSGLEETRRQLGDQSRQMSDLQSKIEENRVRTEELHKESNDKMENYHKNTEQRLENLSEMMRNLSRDREQESPLQENGANQGISGPRSTQKATELPQIPIPDRRMLGSSTNLEHSGNHSKDFHRDFIDRSMSSRGDSVAKVDGDRQILCGSSMEDSCPSKSEDDLSEIDATIDTSIHEIVQDRSEAVGGVDLGAQSNAFEANSISVTPIGYQNSPPRLVTERVVPRLTSTKTSEVSFKLSSLTEAMVTKQTEGNSRLELVDWHFHVLNDSLGVENLELHSLRVDDIVGSKNFEFMMNAQEVFDKLPEKELDDVNDSIDFLGILGDSYGSSSFVFDPGKRNVFPLHIEEVETLVILVFDPGIACTLSIHFGCC